MVEDGRGRCQMTRVRKAIKAFAVPLLAAALIPVVAQTPHVNDERATSFETFVLNLGDGLAPGITPPPPQKLRVPVAYLARRGKHVSTGSIALQANYAD